MSRWTANYEAHPIHETLRHLKELVNAERTDVDEGEVGERRRFLKVVENYETILSKADPEIVPPDKLDQINSLIQQHSVIVHATKYKNSGNVQSLVNANDQLTHVISQGPFYIDRSSKQTSGSRDSIKRLESEVDNAVDALAKKKSDLEETLDQLSAKITGSNTKLKDFEAVIDRRKSEVDSQIAQWQQQFSDAQETRSKQFADKRAEFEQKSESALSTVLDTAETNFKEKEDQLASRISEILTDADEKHKSILELYELTAGDSVGAGHLRNAQEERTQANVWRWISITFIALTVGWLVFAYQKSEMAEYNANVIWGKLITVFPITGVLLYGAAFSAQQSNRHRQSEKRARWFALQIKALDPFINSLELEDRNTLKKELTSQFFANSDEVNENASTVLDEHAYKVIIKGITDILGKMPKSQ